MCHLWEQRHAGHSGRWGRNGRLASCPGESMAQGVERGLLRKALLGCILSVPPIISLTLINLSHPLNLSIPIYKMELMMGVYFFGLLGIVPDSEWVHSSDH